MILRHFLFLAIGIAALFPVAGATAQSSLSDIEASLKEKGSELAKVDALLSAPDANDRIAAMDLLIRSDNPVFIRKAKEAGLFSSDPNMRAAALKAILDGGGPFRLVLNLKGQDEEMTNAKKWLVQYRGSWDVAGTVGSYTFSTSDYDPKSKCWKFLGSSNCAFILSGETASLQGWGGASGELTLGADGKLRGSFLATGGRAKQPVPAEINLAE